MRELNLVAKGTLRWLDRPQPALQAPDDVIVRPFVLSRCDGDILPINTPVSRLMQVGVKTRVLDHGVTEALGPRPFAGPLPIGHECVAEVVQTGSAVTSVVVGDKVVVPYAVSCGQCEYCVRGLTGKCSTTRDDGHGHERAVSLYGFGPAAGPYGCMASDWFRVPHANHMLVPLPSGLDPLRVAASGDNLSDGWRLVVPHLRDRPDATVLVVGGMARSIGLYAAGIAAAHGARVDYSDSSAKRLAIAESLGVRPLERASLLRFPKPRQEYDIVVEASSLPTGLRYAVRSTGAGGICAGAGWYMAANTGVPLMHMFLNDVTLRLSLAHTRPVLPDVLNWVRDNDFPAEKVTTAVESFDDAPQVYGKRTTKLVLAREPLE